MALTPGTRLGVYEIISPTITSRAMTQAGMILGPAAYMSPEQAKGRPVDRRADIWAFGAVLYEMLAGTRAFPGEDITDTIVSVISKEPDWNALPASRAPHRHSPIEPDLGARAHNATLEGVRRLHLPRIRYDLYYRVVEGPPRRLEILALWHSNRGATPPV